MAIDMSKMRDRLNTLQTKSNGGGSSAFWRPSDGNQTIRIVAPKDGDPFKDYHFHYNVGNNSGFLCPKKNYGEECAVCDFSKKLYKAGDEESVKMARELNARQRFFSPVLVRGEENLGVKMWGYGKMAYETLLNLVLNPEYGDITDTEKGTDLRIDYGKKQGQSFPTTDIRPMRRTSALAETEEQVTTLLESLPSRDEVFDHTTFEQCEKVLKETIGEMDTSEGSSETTRYNKPATDTKDDNLESVTDIDSAFNDLLA